MGTFIWNKDIDNREMKPSEESLNIKRYQIITSF